MAGGFKDKMLAWQDRIAAKYGSSIATREARRAAWWHFQLMDHAFLRGLWTNLDQIAPGVWRANQPSPRRLESYQRKLGLKSVVNLRGGSQQGFYLFEAEVCHKLGLTLHDVQNCMCEYSKYCRALLGEGKPKNTYIPEKDF